MLIDLKNIKVYLISPGTGKYRPRVHTVFERLVEAGYTNIEFFRSIPDPSGTNSLTRTNIAIFKKELQNDQPFIILEDDCQEYFKLTDMKVTIPENTDVLYLGVATWVYPYSYETLGKGYHIREHTAEDHTDIDETVMRIRGMTSGHAIVFFNREYIRRFINLAEPLLCKNMPHDLIFATMQSTSNVYALKKPLYYQDSTLGGQEPQTRLVYNGTKYI